MPALMSRRAAIVLIITALPLVHFLAQLLVDHVRHFCVGFERNLFTLIPTTEYAGDFVEVNRFGLWIPDECRANVAGSLCAR
jgi:hypothetical protein